MRSRYSDARGDPRRAISSTLSQPAGPLHSLPTAVRPRRCHRTPDLVRPTSSTRPAPQPHCVTLQAAGMVIGKTNTEFGTEIVQSRPRTHRNPRDLSRSAGGSSRGAAVALAARMVPIADGSDLGVPRNPAAFNNIVGLRPASARCHWPTRRPTPCPAVGPRPWAARSEMSCSSCARRAGPA